MRVFLDDPRSSDDGARTERIQRHAIREVGFGNELTMALSLAHGIELPQKARAEPRIASWLWHPSHWGSANEYVSHWARVAPHVLPALRDRHGMEADRSWHAHAVVHCRCNPVPFVRHPEYHLPAPSYWPFVSRHLRRNGVRDVMVVVNATWEHTPQEQARACLALAAGLRRHFASAGFVTALRDEATMGEVEAYRAMLGSHTLVASTPSSFSFHAGLAKASLHGRARYVTPLFDHEERGVHPRLAQLVPWTMHTAPPVRHAAVGDYVGYVLEYARQLEAPTMAVDDGGGGEGGGDGGGGGGGGGRGGDDGDDGDGDASAPVEAPVLSCCDRLGLGEGMRQQRGAAWVALHFVRCAAWAARAAGGVPPHATLEMIDERVERSGGRAVEILAAGPMSTAATDGDSDGGGGGDSDGGDSDGGGDGGGGGGGGSAKPLELGAVAGALCPMLARLHADNGASSLLPPDERHSLVLSTLDALSELSSVLSGLGFDGEGGRAGQARAVLRVMRRLVATEARRGADALPEAERLAAHIELNLAIVSRREGDDAAAARHATNAAATANAAWNDLARQLLEKATATPRRQPPPPAAPDNECASLPSAPPIAEPIAPAGGHGDEECAASADEPSAAAASNSPPSPSPSPPPSPSPSPSPPPPPPPPPPLPPPSGVLVLMFSTRAILGHAALAAAVNRAYAARHGYRFVHEVYDEGVQLEPTQERVRVLRRHLPTAELVLWLDSDAAVIDFSRRVEDFVREAPGAAQLLMAGHRRGYDRYGVQLRPTLRGEPSGLNCGVMIWRRSEWALCFLDAWWRACVSSAARLHAFHEQGVLQHLLETDAHGLRDRTHVVTPAYRLNRDDDRPVDRCDFVLHLWGHTNAARERAFAQVCAGVRPDEALGAPIEMPRFNVSGCEPAPAVL